MANLALFDIDLDGGDRGFDASYGVTHNLKLRSAASVVSSVSFSVWDPNPLLFDTGFTILQNPPFKSKSAPLIQLVGSTTNYTVSPTTLVGNVGMPMPAFGYGTWLVRCLVNGGMKDGALHPDYIHHRAVTLRGALLRPPVATERQEYEVDGFAGSIDDLMLSANGNPLGFSHAADSAQKIGRTVTIPTHTMVDFRFRWVGNDIVNSDHLIRQGRYIVLRRAAASLTVVQAYTDDFPMVRSDATWTADLNTSGVDVQQRYKGDGTNGHKWILQMWASASKVLT